MYIEASINCQEQDRLKHAIYSKLRTLFPHIPHLINLIDLSFLDANQFIKGMDQFVDVIEREKHVFNVEVKDPGAPVDFFINGKKVSKSDERCEYVNLGEGKHQLIIHHIKMEDLGTIEAKTPSNR